MRLACRGLSIALLAIPATPAASARNDFRPVDQAAAQPDFFTFRTQLKAAIARRDIQALLAVVRKDIKNSFGGTDGVDEFKQIWELDKPGTLILETLARVLALGGRRTRRARSGSRLAMREGKACQIGNWRQFGSLGATFSA